MKKSASCSRGSPRGCNVSSSAAVSNPAVPTYARLIPLSKNLLRWPASAAPRFRRESPWGLARAPACGAWGTIPTRRGCSRPLPGTRIWRGFDLHANVAVPAADRTRLERLCRYLLRPAVAQDRLRLLDDGRIVLTLKTAWADGTRQLVFEPLTLLEKLAALTTACGASDEARSGVHSSLIADIISGSEMRRAWRAWSQEGRGKMENPSAARRSWPRWSSTRYSMI